MIDRQDLTEAIEAGDEDQFLDKLQAYDSMSKLDRWKTTIFLKVKEGIDGEPDLTQDESLMEVGVVVNSM